MSEIEPERLLEGETPRLIDEWQIAPKLWDAARYKVDIRGEEGQFILTGSAVPVDSEDITFWNRSIYWLMMRPMSLYESGESSGEVSLKDLFNKPDKITGISEHNIDDLTFLICRGGWPHAIGMKEKAALSQAEAYYDAVVKNLISIELMG